MVTALTVLSSGLSKCVALSHLEAPVWCTPQLLAAGCLELGIHYYIWLRVLAGCRQYESEAPLCLRLPLPTLCSGMVPHGVCPEGLVLCLAGADPSLGLISTFGKVFFPTNIWSIHSATRLREVFVSILHILFVCVAHKSGFFIFIYSILGLFCLFSALHGKLKLTEHPQGNFANIVLFLQLRACAWPMAGVRWILLNKLMSENELWEFPLAFQPQIPQIGHPCSGCF